MLESLRKHAGGWVARILLGLLVLSFGVWGVSDIFRGGFAGDKVAVVGSTPITMVEFQNAIQEQQRQLRQPVTGPQAQLLGQMVLQQLVGSAALRDDARTLGISLSTDELTRQVQSDPAFKGAGGNFNYGVFQSRIQNAGLTESMYLARRREQAQQEQLLGAIAGGLTAPEAYLKALHEYQTEERSISYVVVDAAGIGDIADPTPEELSTYFEANKETYRAPETRQLAVVSLSPQDIAKPDEVTDEEAQAAYEQDKGRFTAPGTRHVWQIVFTDPAKAEAAAKALQEGQDFDAVAAAQGVTPVDLGVVSRSGMAFAKIADAAFALEDGQSSGIVDGPFGPTIVHVTDITPEVVKPFDEVKDQVKELVAERKASSQILDLTNQIEDALAGGETLQEVAPKFGLTARIIDGVDQQGRDINGDPVPDLPGGQQLLADAFDSDVGLSNAPIDLGASRMLWFDVLAINPAHDRPLEDVRDRVVGAWKDDQRKQRLDAEAKQIVDRLGAGEAIDKVAADLGLTVQTATALKRDTAPTAPLSGGAIEAAFGGPNGHVASAAGAEPNTRIVLVVTDATVPAYFAGAPDEADAQTQLASSIGQDLFGGYVADLRDRLGVSFNQAAIQQVLGNGSGG